MSTRLSEAIERGEFVVTSEIGPPKGIDVDPALRRVEIFRDRVHAVNVTELQNARMRLGSMAMCNQLRMRGVEPIMHVSCRDRNRLALQSDLLGAWILKIKNVLALTGDHTRLGDQPAAKAVFDLDSVQLLHLIDTLNGGHDLAGKHLDGKPRFFVGAVANPSADLRELQVLKLRKKMDAGAQFCQTQAIFAPDDFADFVEQTRAVGVHLPILAGVVVLKSAKMARFMNEHIPGIHVPDAIIAEMEGLAGEDRRHLTVDIAARIIRAMRPFVQGVHIMAMGWEDLVPEILDAAEVGRP